MDGAVETDRKDKRLMTWLKDVVYIHKHQCNTLTNQSSSTFH